MAVRRFVVPMTVAADGTGTFYTPPVYGKVVSLRYVKTDFANGVDFTVTAETTTEGIWAESDVNASGTRYPRAATHSIAGVAALYASGGVAVLAPIALGGDRIKVVVAQGGVSTTGTLHVTVDG
jgi:hypothetical protein